jgi:hypothetical protein
MMTAYLAARLSAHPVSTGSLIRAATAKLRHAVRGRRKAFGSSLGISDSVAALG